MIRIWGKLIKKNKIINDHVAESSAEPSLDATMDCIHVICQTLDLPRPIVLKKHEQDLMQFNQTRFFPEDFVEQVNFARFDVEMLIDKKDKQSKSYL